MSFPGSVQGHRSAPDLRARLESRGVRQAAAGHSGGARARPLQADGEPGREAENAAR